ncbi:hypothetical protein DM860_006908 [Cuscuta australis]|uniref:Single-stranded DNA binding protein Ssb-like OB fold domain-containing protein n=1 Tax=Cuscuta australis TaxID=267555 RepID=A0A328E707_9ASTE|nr:hypothetical protein DM860_006908 [Cuscuta australis]
MAEQKKQVDLTKVNQLRPSSFGLSLKVKVVSSKLIGQSGRAQGRVAECLVGDETGIVVFTARNDQESVNHFSHQLFTSKRSTVSFFRISKREISQLILAHYENLNLLKGESKPMHPGLFFFVFQLFYDTKLTHGLKKNIFDMFFSVASSYSHIPCV